MKQHRHAELALQLLQQLQDLRLDGDVERRGRLVGDQEVRLVGQRHGDHHPLALAAGKLVGIGAEALAPGPGMPTRCSSSRVALARAWRPGHALVQDQGLVDLLLTRCSGLSEVMGSWKIIDPVAAHLAQRRRGRADQLLAAESGSSCRSDGRHLRDRAAAA